MPCYNAAKTISWAVNSVLKQTYTNFELIICNDASTDDTEKILSEFRDKRIKILRNEKNLGEGRTRDKCFSLATGEWITVIDADDEWLNTRLEKLLEFALEGRIVFDNLIECATKSNGELIKISRVRGIFSFKKIILSPTPVPLKSFIAEKRLIVKPLFNKNLLEKKIFHSDASFSADTYFILMALKSGAELFYVPKALYKYRLTVGAASSNPSRFQLMEKTIQECRMGWNLKPDEAHQFEKKLNQLKAEREYYEKLNFCKTIGLALIIKQFYKDPRFLGKFVARSVIQLKKIAILKISRAESR